MFRFLLDEDTNPRIRTGILRLFPELDIVTAAQVGLLGQLDPEVLAWAALENRIVVSNDRRTMGVAAAARIEAGQGMPGLLLIRRNASLGEAIRGLEEIVVCMEAGELENQIEYIPVD